MMRRAAALATAVMLAVLALAAPAGAAPKSYPLNPAHNIKIPDYVYSGPCASSATSRDCTAKLVQALNYARGKMSQPDYDLPLRFVTMTGPERLLVLANQDRLLYGRVPLTALNATLDSSAHQGVLHNADPAFVKVNGHSPTGGASNWAAGSGLMRNPLYAYYLWMYDDGPGSGNLGCQHAGDPGCWGHRDGTLHGFGSTYKVIMGASGGTGGSYPYAWTELFEAFRQSDYTPLIPTVQGLNTHKAAPGSQLHISGFGLYHAGPVTVVGHSATILERHNNSLIVKVPSGSGSGYVVVTGNGGTSNKTYAAAFAYS
jgi:hypothetical protein